MDSTPAFTNALINETSPYLLQHAHNPVNWYPWGKEALEKAKNENKLILVSIGYSSCHWCHVMEHESFEDEAIAKIMNANFICIKVDREERPDIDKIYMDAVQLMTGHGGWPLNSFTLPDKRPVFGGTYFQKGQWVNILHQLADLYKTDPAKMQEYATRLTEGVKMMDLVKINPEPQEFTKEILDEIVGKWATQFDNVEGGNNRFPKFPMPVNYKFLLRYAYQTDDKKVLGHVLLTLRKMAMGGIYDQVGGGFSRYSVDGLWKVPHFEKMLYDNAQLVSLYCEAYRFTKDQLFKEVVYQTLEFITREMTSPEGTFYSALDADSEGVEGKFYVWTKEELKQILKEKFAIAEVYYNVNDAGYWEHDNYILLRREDDSKVAGKLKLTEEKLKQEILEINKILLAAREKRIRPGLDDKSLTSWNALMLNAYTDAYKTFNEEAFLAAAQINADFILKTQRTKEGGLFRSYKKGKSTITGYLEDYAFTIEALINLYEATFEEHWLQESKALLDYTFTHFYDNETGMFWFTPSFGEELITRKMEVSDNVIPASNSAMAKNLYKLHHYFPGNKYNEMSLKMLHNVMPHLKEYAPGYANWCLLLADEAYPYFEIAVIGTNALEKSKELNNEYIPNMILAGAKTSSDLPFLKGRFKENETLIYVCTNNTCQAPVSGVNEALSLIKK